LKTKGTDVKPVLLKGRVARSLKRQEKALEGRMEGRERMWGLR
jgi:hypothetical protein